MSKLQEIKGRTRFQKIVFLLMEKEGVDFGYDFIPYYYGPYAQDLQTETNLLEAASLVEVQPVGRTPYVHRLTQKGKQAADEIERNMGKDEARRLSRILSRYRRRSTTSLVNEAKQLIGMSR